MAHPLSPEQERVLFESLGKSQEMGFLGPGPVQSHIEHADRFLKAVLVSGASVPGEPEIQIHALDLGSGGGVPGLVLALLLPGSRWTLLDSMAKRCDFLRSAIVDLQISDRVEVAQGRAEILGRDAEFRHMYGLVTARSFGSPGATAECGAPFLRAGGVLLVSEPPAGPMRWPEGELAILGLSRQAASQNNVAVLKADELCAGRYPRRTGVPFKRPLF